MAMAISRVASLSIDRNDDFTENKDSDLASNDELNIPRPLDKRVIEVVQSCKEKTNDNAFIIRPARLAADLGISVEDACAELCGLLTAVGGGEHGAWFEFESLPKSPQPVMVFYFPHDFAKRAMRARRAESIREALVRIGYVALRVVQIVTAFGLILSLLILCIAAIAGLVAALIALGRSGNSNNGAQRVMRQIQTLLYTMRQLLWCFALFGPDDGGEGSFYREMAYDTSLCLSVCCGNPMNAFYWLRVSQLSRRRQRAFRGWGGRSVAIHDSAYGVEGVSLVRRSDSDEAIVRTTSDVSAEHRGLLSVAVEFLFGPSPFQPGPTPVERWHMRAAYIVKHLSSNTGVTLLELCPYADYPPAHVGDAARITEQGLLIVAHFNGQPSSSKTSLQDATFTFPELLAESEVALRSHEFIAEQDESDWRSILYRQDSLRRTKSTLELPCYLSESLFRLTHLPFNLFSQCVALGALNLVGVMMLGPSFDPGGMLELKEENFLGGFLKGYLLPILRFYAVLFFALPLTRLCLILVLNAQRRRRNERRRQLVADIPREAIY
ncbi:hypothetical protein MPSEU_000257600 [Mayamaea pseudoterrestris]|nr:hypothetical protein MPSEU_000257600 [Mayamaea pseudoterrestris]